MPDDQRPTTSRIGTRFDSFFGFEPHIGRDRLLSHVLKSPALRFGRIVGFWLGVALGILALIDYLWLCTSDCGSVATAIFGTAIAPALGAFAGYSAVLLVGLTVMVQAGSLTRSRRCSVGAAERQFLQILANRPWDRELTVRGPSRFRWSNGVGGGI